MPCFFCIAMVATVGSALVSSLADHVREELPRHAVGEVRHVSDTGAVARFETEWTHQRQSVPVAVTVYKRHERVRIQPLTHELDRAEAEKMVRDIATRLGLEVAHVSDETDEALVRRAVDQPERAQPSAERAPRRGAPPRSS